MENILKQCLLSLHTAIPDGPSWHRDLLELAHRKGVVSETSRGKLAELLAFRHFMRHAYALELSPERMESLVKSLPATYEAFQKEIADFCDSR